MTLAGKATEFATVCLAGAIIGLGIVAIEGKWLLMGLAGAIAIIGAMLSVRLGLATLVFMLAILNRDRLFAFSLPFLGGGLKPTDIILASILFGWFARLSLGQRGPSWRAQPLVAAFLGWCAASAVIGIEHGYDYKESLMEFRPILQLLLVFPIITELRREDVPFVVYVILGAGIAAAIYAIILFALGEGETASYTQSAVRIMVVDWFYMLFASALGVGLLTDRGANVFFLPLCLAVSVSGLVVTFARDAWLSFITAGAAAVALARRPGRNRLVVGIGLAGCLMAVVPAATGFSTDILDNVSSRFLSVGDYEEDVSAQHRFNEWQTDLAMIYAHPLAGNGLGATVAFFSPMYQGDQEGFWTETTYMHNSYLWLGAKTGLIGLALFLAMIIMPVVTGISALRRMKDGWERACVIGLIVGLIAVAVSAMFASMSTSDHGMPLLAIVIGCLHLLCTGQVPASGSAPTKG